MAALTVTAANVAPSSGVQWARAVAGAAITAGQPIYLDATDANKARLADANATAATAEAVGIAMHSCASGQTINYATSGIINLGATLVANMHYFVGGVAGEINPQSDVTTGWYGSRLGYATSTSLFKIQIELSGVLSA